jgi:hypothetical protein
VPLPFVDLHSHVVPSGDDGAQTLAEGLELCELAARRGTDVLYATPHVSPALPLTRDREESVRAAFEELKEVAPVELRLGFELTPWPALLREDPARYALEGSDTVLVEVPFVGPADGFLAVCEHVEATGLTVLVAHPERTEAVRADPKLPDRLGRARPAPAGERVEPARAPRAGSRADRLAAGGNGDRGRRRVRRSPAHTAGASRRCLRAREGESGGGGRGAALRRQGRHIPATASISRSRARRLSASVSI